MSRTLIKEGLIALKEIARGPTAPRPTIEPEPFKFDFFKKDLKPAGQRRLTPVPFFDTGDTSSARPEGRTDRDRKSRLLKAPPIGLKKYPRSIGQDLNIARPDKFDNDGKLLRKGTPGLDLRKSLGGDISGTYIIPNYGKGPGVER